jgi:hypothetical protein
MAPPYAVAADNTPPTVLPVNVVPLTILEEKGVTV